MKILVTGDLGKLGSLASKQLREAGHTVIGYDIRRDKREDLLRPSVLFETMTDCEMVVHLAGLPHPNKGGMERYFEINVRGSLNVLVAAQSTGVRRVIYTSSTAYYGCDINGRLNPAYFPIDEKHPPASVEGYSVGKLEPYNQSKVMVEQLLAYFGTNRLIETVALRLAPANTKEQQYPKGIDWQTCTDWRRGCFFANCHPDSVADAIALAVEAKGPFWYEAFNITDKYTHKSVDVQAFLKQEYPYTIAIDKQRLFESHCLFDISKAERVLGFKPNEELE